MLTNQLRGKQKKTLIEVKMTKANQMNSHRINIKKKQKVVRRNQDNKMTLRTMRIKHVSIHRDIY